MLVFTPFLNFGNVNYRYDYDKSSVKLLYSVKITIGISVIFSIFRFQLISVSSVHNTIFIFPKTEKGMNNTFFCT